MSNPTPDDDTTSGSKVVNPPDAGRLGPVTRQRTIVSAVAQAAAATLRLRKQQQQPQHQLLVRERNLLLLPLTTTR